MCARAQIPKNVNGHEHVYNLVPWPVEAQKILLLQITNNVQETRSNTMSNWCTMWCVLIHSGLIVIASLGRHLGALWHMQVGATLQLWQSILKTLIHTYRTKWHHQRSDCKSFGMFWSLGWCGIDFFLPRGLKMWLHFSCEAKLCLNIDAPLQWFPLDCIIYCLATFTWASPHLHLTGWVFTSMFLGTL